MNMDHESHSGFRYRKIPAAYIQPEFFSVSALRSAIIILLRLQTEWEQKEDVDSPETA